MSICEMRTQLQRLYPGKFIKIKIRHVADLTLHKKEVNALQKLQNTDITPKMYSHNIIRIGKTKNYITYIVLENCGQSLMERYIPKEQWNERGGPGRWVDKTYDGGEIDGDPFRDIPTDVQAKAKKILKVLLSFGILYEDIHPGNFLINNDGDVKIIDLECYSLF